MPDWTAQALHQLESNQEVHVATRRRDGTLRRPRIIWVVTAGNRVFICSTNGRDSAWFRAAIATGAGQIQARRAAYDVTFTQVHDETALTAADAGYRSKCGHYASIVDHLEEAVPRAATLEVHPA
jgi:hypothetical protein